MRLFFFFFFVYLLELELLLCRLYERLFVTTCSSLLTSTSVRLLAISSGLHETNTFHPLPTKKYEFYKTVPKPPSLLENWKKNQITTIPGLGAEPDGGGTVDGAACRDAISRIIQSLKDSLPVDGVFLQIHGAMHALGFSINNLSLFGLVLAIGIVVDDAIVVVENVERNISLGLSPADATKRAMDFRKISCTKRTLFLLKIPIMWASFLVRKSIFQAISILEQGIFGMSLAMISPTR